MRLLIYSDLHLEFSGFDVSGSGYDAVVLAGDIGVGTAGVEWAMGTFSDVPVLYVFGNHEFYHCELNNVKREAREIAAGSNVNVVENESVRIDDVDFLCATLWTDFNLAGNSVLGKMNAKMWMNDYRVIHNGDDVLDPDDTQRYHYESRRYLDEGLSSDPSARKRVVVTHHAPSARSLTGERVSMDLSFAYASAMDGLVAQSNAALWVHGHTHESVDYRIGGTRVVCNPRGYSYERNGAGNANFVPNLVIEV